MGEWAGAEGADYQLTDQVKHQKQHAQMTEQPIQHACSYTNMLREYL